MSDNKMWVIGFQGLPLFLAGALLDGGAKELLFWVRLGLKPGSGAFFPVHLWASCLNSCRLCVHICKWRWQYLYQGRKEEANLVEMGQHMTSTWPGLLKLRAAQSWQEGAGWSCPIAGSSGSHLVPESFLLLLQGLEPLAWFQLPLPLSLNPANFTWVNLYLSFSSNLNSSLSISHWNSHHKRHESSLDALQAPKLTRNSAAVTESLCACLHPLPECMKLEAAGALSQLLVW